ncbi:glycosyltransferase [Zhouia spongiae]|uniref:Glycosyltransferase n=1 Tax=Zhouia spongiae TaxID=2202721 RepID=A0ABY3YS14_9FLAO|nr:glycosyltransferase [Zhouia spongiae]UNZ00368.1 glycosyltransferase [Zhouia spongiae]
MNYYLIIPAHNEEAFLKLTLDSVVKQTLLPKKVVVVNDHSTDATEAIIDQYTNSYSYIHKLNTTSSTLHMPGSKVVNAFKKGFETVDDAYDFIVKLDADLILPKTYFETIATTFKQHSTAGMAGGFIYEENNNGQWLLNHPMNKDHIRGAFKAYTKACFKAIGGLRSSMGWDTVDELLCRYHGYDIITIDSMKVKHLRPTGKGYNKKARLLQGEAMYKMRYGFWLTAIASAKMAAKQKKPKLFVHNLQGFFQAKKNKLDYIVNEEEGAFIRNYRFQNVKRKLF